MTVAPSPSDADAPATLGPEAPVIPGPEAPARVNPPDLFDPTPFGYAQAVVAPAGARIAVIAGQGGADATGTLPPGFEAQAEAAFANLRRAIEGIGARPDRVLGITIYVVGHNPSRLGPLAAAVRATFGEALPAQTLVPVPALALPGMLVEVEALAALG